MGWVLLVCLAAMVLSCDEMERHRALTFFFDGVPPMGGAGFEGEPFDANAAEPEQPGQKPAWYVHEPQKDCTNCHRKQSTGAALSSQTRLLAPAPQLCYKCHDDPTVSASFVHGPVAVGQCLFCHNPHRSKVGHLLREAEPKLCYLCHDASMIELIPAHLAQQTSACTDCHYPHSGPTKSLLKGAAAEAQRMPARSEPAVAPAQPDVIPMQPLQVEEPPKPPQAEDKTAEERKILLDVFSKVSRLIQEGKLQEARGYLEPIKDSKALTEDERRKIADVLRLIDDLSTREGAKPGGTQEKPQADRGPAAPGTPANSDDAAAKRRQEVADLYYRSMAYYRDGQLRRARDGFVEVLNSRLIPAEMENTVRNYIADIDRKLAGDTQKK